METNVNTSTTLMVVPNTVKESVVYLARAMETCDAPYERNDYPEKTEKHIGTPSGTDDISVETEKNIKGTRPRRGTSPPTVGTLGAYGAWNRRMESRRSHRYFSSRRITLKTIVGRNTVHRPSYCSRLVRRTSGSLFRSPPPWEICKAITRTNTCFPHLNRQRAKPYRKLWYRERPITRITRSVVSTEAMENVGASPRLNLKNLTWVIGKTPHENRD